MYRVHLTEAQRVELQRHTRAPNIMPRTRDRLEMVRLSDAGWSIPKIAVYLRISEKRVRYWIKQFLTGGFEALPDQPHVGQQSRLTPALVAALQHEVEQSPRTWTAQQLADWLAEQHGVRLTPNHLARRLKRARFSYKRTERGRVRCKKWAARQRKRAPVAVNWCLTWPDCLPFESHPAWARA